MWGPGMTNLFELFNVYVELTAQFSFCVGKGGDLGGEGATALGLGVSSLPLDLMLRGQIGYLGVFVA